MNLPQWLKKEWREAAIWAVIVAFLLEFAINLFSSRTMWHRMADMEHRVQNLEHRNELEELQVRNQFDELRRKAAQNEQVIEKVEEKVEKKKSQ